MILAAAVDLKYVGLAVTAALIVGALYLDHGIDWVKSQWFLWKAKKNASTSVPASIDDYEVDDESEDRKVWLLTDLEAEVVKSGEEALKLALPHLAEIRRLFFGQPGDPESITLYDALTLAHKLGDNDAVESINSVIHWVLTKGQSPTPAPTPAPATT